MEQWVAPFSPRRSFASPYLAEPPKAMRRARPSPPRRSRDLRFCFAREGRAVSARPFFLPSWPCLFRNRFFLPESSFLIGGSHDQTRPEANDSRR